MTTASVSTDISRTTFPAFFARHGAKIFPIRKDTKKPMFAGWQKMATSDPEELAAWAVQFPGCAWAVACAESGWICVEIDVKARRTKDKDSEQAGTERAWQAWLTLCAQWGLNAYAPHVFSRSGGWHFFFKPPAGVDVRELVQRGLVKLPEWHQHVIETRINGFVLIPPSTFDGSAYVWNPGAPADLYDAPQGLLDASAKRHGLPGDAPQQAIVKPGTYELRAFAKYVCKVHHRVGMPREVWRATIYSMVAQFGRYAAFQIATAIHDGESDTSYQIENLVGSANETFVEGDSTLKTLFKHARDNGIRDSVPKCASTMFGIPAAPLDIDAILSEIDEENLPVITSPPTAPCAPTQEILPPPAAFPPPTGAVSILEPGAGPLDSDDALALSFAEVHGGELRYIQDLGRWLRWDSTRWRQDKTSTAYDMIRKHLRKFAASINHHEQRRIASAKTVAAVETMVRKDQRIVTEVAMWDADIWLLNTPSGTIDLRTGKTRPSERGDHMTKTTAVGQGGECPMWLAFLDRIMGGDAELIAFLQRAFGYALCGSTRDHAFFFLYGGGGNGKGVFLNTIAAILGDYSSVAPIEMFLECPFQGHPTDVAGLVGARLAVADEIPPGRRWDETKMKRLTGGDKIPARFMRQDFFDYVPQFKLTLVGNNKPRLHTVNEAIRRRLNLIPFTVEIPEGERDTSLPERLKAEWPGILKWLVEGCLAWQRGGLQPPASVREATDDYIAGEDVLAAWLDERCVQSAEGWARRDVLFKSWAQWATDARETVGSANQFYDTMRNHHFEVGKREGVRGFRGVELKPQPAAPAWSVPGGFLHPGT